MSNLYNSIANSVAQETSAEILRDAADVGLSAFADGTILENIPFLGMIHKVYKLGTSISDRRFCNKVVHFLYELHRISREDRAGVVEKLRANHDYAQRTGEVLIEILDKCDDNRKAAIIAKLFSGYVLGRISFDSFNRFSRIVNQANLFDLSKLRDYLVDPSLIGADVSLLVLGIIGIKTKTTPDGVPVSQSELARTNRIEYYVNETGETLFEEIRNYI